jgi:hypothetical protein
MEGAPEAAQDSVGAAVGVAEQIGNDGLAVAAQSAFVDSMSTTVLVAAGVALLGALVAAVVMPRKEPAVVDERVAFADEAAAEPVAA